MTCTGDEECSFETDVNVGIEEAEELPSDHVADLVEYIVESLVDDPDALSIEVIDSEAHSRVEVHVAAGDVGKVIGRHGREIKAIRTLARACAARYGLCADVEIIG